jgi:hypothetical protein
MGFQGEATELLVDRDKRGNDDRTLPAVESGCGGEKPEQGLARRGRRDEECIVKGSVGNDASATLEGGLVTGMTQEGEGLVKAGRVWTGRQLVL